MQEQQPKAYLTDMRTRMLNSMGPESCTFLISAGENDSARPIAAAFTAGNRQEYEEQ